MKYLLPLLLLSLMGCAVPHYVSARAHEDGRQEACRVQHYCGKDAGKVLMGDKVCYTNHLSLYPEWKGVNDAIGVETVNGINYLIKNDLICR